jgi:hypothetical protein
MPIAKYAAATTLSPSFFDAPPSLPDASAALDPAPPTSKPVAAGEVAAISVSVSSAADSQSTSPGMGSAPRKQKTPRQPRTPKTRGPDAASVAPAVTATPPGPNQQQDGRQSSLAARLKAAQQIDLSAQERHPTDDDVDVGEIAASREAEAHETNSEIRGRIDMLAAATPLLCAIVQRPPNAGLPADGNQGSGAHDEIAALGRLMAAVADIADKTATLLAPENPPAWMKRSLATGVADVVATCWVVNGAIPIDAIVAMAKQAALRASEHDLAPRDGTGSRRSIDETTALMLSLLKAQVLVDGAINPPCFAFFRDRDQLEIEVAKEILKTSTALAAKLSTAETTPGARAALVQGIIEHAGRVYVGCHTEEAARTVRRLKAMPPAEQKAAVRVPGGLPMDGVWREFNIRMSCLAAAAALARPATTLVLSATPPR